LSRSGKSSPDFALSLEGRTRDAAEDSSMAAIRLDEQAIFEVARRIDSAAARETYLQQVCGDDAATGQRVRALLRAFEQSASFLESPAVPLGATVDEPIRERPG